MEQLERLYRLLDELERAVGGRRRLRDCTARMSWPQRGVYFFFEPGEARASNPDAARVVRVGTHAVSRGSRTALWSRLRAHKGTGSGGGNHRGSIFRLHVGAALMNRSDGCLDFPRWGKGASAPREVRQAEVPLERQVSEHIGAMSILWLEVDDEPGPESDRAYIERNVISLLATDGRLDVASNRWLGRNSPRAEIRGSGLWNLEHLTAPFDERALDSIERCIARMPHL